MKLIRVREFGAPEVMQVANIPDPHPAPGQVLVRLSAVGVNPVDTYIRSGSYARLPQLPYTPGTDGAGVIYKLGPAVPATVRAGQRVWLSGSVSGTYADTAICEAHHVHPLPEAVSYAQGAALGVPYTTAYRALFQRGQARYGESVLIHGATGGVGVAAVQFARAAGLHVFATGGTEAGRAMLLDIGAHQALDHSQGDYLDRIAEQTHGRGVDLIIEMLGNVNLASDLHAIARGGRIIIVGARGPVEINPRLIMQKECDVRGVMLFNATAEETTAAHQAISNGLEDGTLFPAIGAEFPLAECAKAHERVMAPGHSGKVVLVCD